MLRQHGDLLRIHLNQPALSFAIRLAGLRVRVDEDIIEQPTLCVEESGVESPACTRWGG